MPSLTEKQRKIHLQNLKRYKIVRFYFKVMIPVTYLVLLYEVLMQYYIGVTTCIISLAASYLTLNRVNRRIYKLMSELAE